MITITPEYLAEQGLSSTIVERFWDKVFVLPYDKGCWLWTGATDHNGYAVIMAKSKRPGNCMAQASRVAYILFRGPIPEGQDMCHHCDEPLCVNPYHLFLGDALANVRDMIGKGRMARGEARAFAKLTSDKVREMRHIYSLGLATYVQIAQRFGVKTGTVGDIIRREKWRHVT